ncbi:hypothetical protein F5B21DRAFT_528897 [Xylaria acuta]|nr:hypothetical protein F5B21DRAFT_528897 [Xylaria acuta]
MDDPVTHPVVEMNLESPPPPGADDPQTHPILSDPSTQLLPITMLSWFSVNKISLLRAHAEYKRNNPSPPPQQSRKFWPPIDVVLNKHRCDICVELPGVSKDDIHLAWSSKDNELAISGYTYRRPLEVSDEQVVRERIGNGFSRFKRTIDFDDLLLGTAMEEAIIHGEEIAAQARMHNGLLVIHVFNLSPNAVAEAVRKEATKGQDKVPVLPLAQLRWTIE